MPAYPIQLLFQRSPGLLLQLAQGRGPVVWAGAGPYKIALIGDPALAHALLTAHHGALSKGSVHRRARPWLGESLLIGEGAEHRRLREAARPAFQRGQVAGYAGHAVAVADALTQRWQPGEARDIAAEMHQLTTLAVARGLGGAPEADSALIDRTLRALAPGLGSRTPADRLLEQIPGSAAHARRQLRAQLDAEIYQIVDRYIAQRGEAPLLEALGAAYTRQGYAGERLRTALRDGMLTFLLAGRETVAAALSWAWHFLSRHPAVERRLHEEIAAVLGGRAPTAADLPQLAYIRQVVAETLRCRPPAWALARRAQQPIQSGALRLEPGHIVLISQYVLHQNPACFADPQRFDPNRWAPDAAPPPQGAYLPFGAGPRRCIGEPLAWAACTLSLAAIAQRWRLIAQPEDRVELSGGTSLQPRGGLWLRVDRRQAT